MSNENPCEDIEIGIMEIDSYNAGYQRGVDPKNHKEDVNELFKSWIRTIRRPAGEYINLAAFKHGVSEGTEDYKKWKLNNGEK